MTGFFIFGGADKVFAAVDKIVFINDPQTIVAGVISAKYQVQLQNSSGEKEPAPDTTYFTLPLDIGTFSSTQTGTPFTASSSIYIATGDYNKYFYYKNNSIGEYIIKTLARNKDNTKQWETEQVVKVVDSITCSSFTYSDWGICSNDTQTRTISTSSPDSCTGGNPEPLTQSCTIGSASTTDTSNQSSVITKTVVKTVYISTHSSPEDISDFNATSGFTTSAGRERIAYIGVPIVFSAGSKMSKSMEGRPANFKWSYGDGFSDIGGKVAHTYKYPGVYSVILNGTVDNINSVSRTKVTVLSPEISLSMTPSGDVEIMNNGKIEINIGGWGLNNATGKFIFAEDTIIGAENKIILSKDDTKIYPMNDGIILVNPSGGEVARIDLGNNSTATTSVEDASPTLTVADAEILYSQYEASLAFRSPKKEIISNENDMATNTMQAGEPQQEIPNTVATVLESDQSTSTQSFWNKIFSLPIRGMKAIARLFYNF